ncbi:DNA cytosine methyltransferase [Pseudomonas fluorescens]|uniref:DNA cytosine methyltransferase n=1 Tax=Pseudomonas fluorescens TaxID=294 RepID=UPI002ACAF315|nr:DNA cytosine methyltransferase [Pseudomonas fluorescens]MDZ5435403.1 DNA cytosine methyltransferase [Pseudomonas fluorescens]
MNNSTPLQVVDLFAGPGGLGEGFSSLNSGNSFNVIVSAEMDPAARKTLRLRAYYRSIKKNNPDALEDYYKFCETPGLIEPELNKSKEQWLEAEEEARQICLGSPEGNSELDAIIKKKMIADKPWVLIGGPPCQAYSIVGRARNRGNSEYKPEDDHRHFLYKEYLRIIQKNRPAVFVMENVKGILSSKIGGESIFAQILGDLADPDKALGLPDEGRGKYRICSLSTNEVYVSGQDPNAINFKNFIVRSEEYGVPQARHRVILVGVNENFTTNTDGIQLERVADAVTVGDVIGSLPKIRSTLSKSSDNNDLWCFEVIKHLTSLHKSLADNVRVDPLLCARLKILRDSFSGRGLISGGLRLPRLSGEGRIKNADLDAWYKDNNLGVWLNHEARGHMSADLGRYIYAATFAEVHDCSPKGHKDFDLPGLAPAHLNWESGKFSDRFRVQLENQPATTVTSHISKDGHYFIHYDPKQCRSLSVREAARLQTFPDNYFFLGNRTQQFHQVGNAVPPLLASKIAAVVEKIVLRGGIGQDKQQQLFS